MKLIDAPIGVFLFNGVLVLKTEYSVDIDGVYIPDCYILDSGEKFWGGMKSKEDFKTKYNELEVEPVDVEVERESAEWIKLEDGLIFKNRAYECSYCNNSLNFDGVNAGRGNANYCPNCGRKMKGRKS